MKPTTPIILLFVVLLIALVWFGIMAQKETALAPATTDENASVQQEELPTVDDIENASNETEFGNDVGMEFPFPDTEASDELLNGTDPNETLEEVAGPGTMGNPIEFSLDGNNFNFTINGTNAPELRVNKGDTVTVTLKSTEGFHDFVIDELGVQSDKVNLGEETTVTFTATEAGEYEYYCSVGSHRAQGMFGKFIVE